MEGLLGWSSALSIGWSSALSIGWSSALSIGWSSALSIRWSSALSIGSAASPALLDAMSIELDAVSCATRASESIGLLSTPLLPKVGASLGTSVATPARAAAASPHVPSATRFTRRRPSTHPLSLLPAPSPLPLLAPPPLLPAPPPQLLPALPAPLVLPPPPLLRPPPPAPAASRSATRNVPWRRSSTSGCSCATKNCDASAPASWACVKHAVAGRQGARRSRRL
eukprot:356209-Chlamydomonas_euryale.AAC.9